MILNTKQFWNWWTTELRSWMTEKFSSVISHIPTDYARRSDISPLAKDTTVAKETNATSNKQEILNAIGSVPTPVIPTDYAKEQTLTTKSAEIKQQATTNTAAIISEIRGHAVSISYDENQQAIIINTASNDEQSE